MIREFDKKDMIIIGPIWFVNLFLVIFFTFTTIFIGVKKEKTLIFPVLKIINNDKKNEKKEKEIDFNKIIERDIFDSMPILPIEEQKPHIQAVPLFNISEIPAPPQYLNLITEEDEEIEYLPPLQIAIKGIIISNNPKNNRVFIENLRTKEERGYFIGDLIEEAQIVFIAKNKVVFIRSNGQQETIYINKIGENEDLIALNIPLNKIIYKDENKEINIDYNYLSKKFHSLGDFLDELGLITYFENGIPIGCQVGLSSEKSFGKELELEEGDIILSINKINVSTHENRMKIYENLFNLFQDAIKNEIFNKNRISLEFIRNGERLNKDYLIVFDFKNNEDYVKKKLSSMSFDEDKISSHRPLFKKDILSEQVEKSRDYEYFNKSMDDEKINLVENGKAGKNNAIFRKN